MDKISQTLGFCEGQKKRRLKKKDKRGTMTMEIG